MHEIKASQRNEIAIESQNLSRRFRPQRFSSLLAGPSNEEIIAVSEVNLVVRVGEVFGLVGPNGAGKTTLIKMLCTMLLPTEGRASVGGYDIVRQSSSVKNVVGLITSNERSFYWRLTGRQNMSFFAQLYKIPYQEAEDWIDELFRFLELKKFENKRFDSYSTGIKQRMAIARGLLNKPKVIFMDEPTKGVDPIHSAELIDIIKEKLINFWAPTVLVTSHNLREIEKLCSRVAIICQGKIQAVGTFEELRSRVNLNAAFILGIRNITEQRLVGIVKRHDLNVLHYIATGDLCDLKVEFDHGKTELNDLFSAIINDGGVIVSCSAVENSFEEVFSKIVLAQG